MTDHDSWPRDGYVHLSAVTRGEPAVSQPNQRGVRVPAYAKTIVAGIVAVVGVVVPIIGQDDFLTTTDIVQMALGIMTAFGVYVVPNAPAGPSPVVRQDEVN